VIGSLFRSAFGRQVGEGGRDVAVAGRDAFVNSIVGYTSADVERLIEAQVSPLRAEAKEERQKFEEFRERANLTEGAALAILAALDKADVPRERLPVELAAAASRYHEVVERLRLFEGSDPVVTRLHTEAHAAVERGAFDEAENLLQQADNEQLAAARRRQEAADRDWLKAAETRAERASFAELRFRYGEAARLYREAADLVPADQLPQQAQYLNSAARVRWYGGQYGEAEPLHRRALAIREDVLGSSH
jgi:tetratricopeptide (TPR) repeat protein